MDTAIKKRNMTIKFVMDSKGMIEKTSFFTGMKEIFGIEDDSLNYFLNDIFDLVDGEGMFNAKDGKLNKKELESVVDAIPDQRGEHIPSDLAETVFNLINKNKNETIEFTEFKKYISKILKGVSQTQIKSTFNTLSDNKPGMPKQTFIDYVVTVINGLALPQSGETEDKPTE